MKVRIKFFYNGDILKNEMGEELNICTNLKNKKES